MRGLDDVQGLDVRSLRLKSDLSEFRVRLKGAWYPPGAPPGADLGCTWLIVLRGPACGRAAAARHAPRRWP